MPDMPRPRPPYLQRERTRHGKMVWYVRKGSGPRIRIHGDYGSPEFMANYELAVRGEKPQAPAASKGSLAWLIERYQDSGAFTKELASLTQQNRRAIYRRIVETGGDIQLSKITEQVITEGRERRKDKPQAANNYVKAMRALFKWAKGAKLVDNNPSIGLTKINVEGEPHKDWPMEYVLLYCEKYPLGTRPRLAIDLLLYTGLSREIVRLMKSHIRGGFFELPRSKSGTEATVWICPALQASMDACPSKGLFILPSVRGDQWSRPAFGNKFADWCRDAGVPAGYTSHGLRRSGATLAAENGATHAELMAMFGWSDEAMASYYIKRANRRKLARGAGERLISGTSIPAPADPLPRTSEKE